MYILNREPFLRQADMLQYALEEGLIKDTDVFSELQGLSPEETVQIVMDFGDMNEVCSALLAFDEEPNWQEGE